MLFIWNQEKKSNYRARNSKITSFLGYTEICFIILYYNNLTEELSMSTFFGSTFSNLFNQLRY